MTRTVTTRIATTLAVFCFGLIGSACAQQAESRAAAPSVFKVFAPSDLANYVKPTEAELRKRLTPLQYDVTQEEYTETPFNNQYWNNHADGIYVDVVSGAPLFSSLDKYESGTGWPSFTKPLIPTNITTKTDNFLGYERVEVRSKHANSHLGHVFEDGPRPTGLRYCMNSAAMRFVPVDKLAQEGYAEFAKLFVKKP